MRRARVGRAWWLVLVAAVGCTPMEPVGRFDGELGAAKERRRVVALASPT